MIRIILILLPDNWLLSHFPQALEGDCGFLAANLYAKSVFGEDALANIRYVIYIFTNLGLLCEITAIT